MVSVLDSFCSPIDFRVFLTKREDMGRSRSTTEFGRGGMGLERPLLFPLPRMVADEVVEDVDMTRWGRPWISTLSSDEDETLRRPW